MHPLRSLLIIAGLYCLLFLTLLIVLLVQAAVLVWPFGRGEEFALHVWQPGPQMLVTLWYQNATTHVRLLSMHVPIMPIALSVACLVLAITWWPSFRSRRQMLEVEA
jgi:hypothetical protein